MAISTTSWTTTAAQDWASATWSASDPSYLLNSELSTWINAINDTTIIEMVANPGSATLRADSDYVQWVLRAREADTTSDWGILFHRRFAGTDMDYHSTRCYYNRVAGSANNGYGSYSTFGTQGHYTENFSVAGAAFVAYEPSGPTPWFVYSWRNSTVSNFNTHVLMRLDTSDLVSGGYYPASGVSKWMYVIGANNSAPTYPATSWVPVKDNNTNLTPVRARGTTSAGISGWLPDATHGTGYFGRLLGQYGHNHYLGRPTGDFLLSNASTGVWGDTTTIDGNDYTCLGQFWVRTA